MKHYLISATACIALSACISGFTIPDDRLPVATTKELCQSFTAQKVNGNEQGAARVLSEIERRNTFTKREFAGISQRQAMPGMSEEAGLCAKGYYWRDLNTTMTTRGIHKQYVFGDDQYVKRTYLYTDNGVVTATQD